MDEQLGIYARRAHQPLAQRDDHSSVSYSHAHLRWLALAQKSVEELGILREEPALVFSGGSFAVADLWLYQLSALDALLDVEVKFSEVFPNAPFVINIHTGTAEVTTIAIDPSGAQLAINRRIPASKNSIRRSRAPPDTRRLFELPMATSRFDSCSIPHRSKFSRKMAKPFSQTSSSRVPAGVRLGFLQAVGRAVDAQGRANNDL